MMGCGGGMGKEVWRGKGIWIWIWGPMLRLTGRLGWSTMASPTTLHIGRPAGEGGLAGGGGEGLLGGGGLLGVGDLCRAPLLLWSLAFWARRKSPYLMLKKCCSRTPTRTFLQGIAPKISGLDHALEEWGGGGSGALVGGGGLLRWSSGIPIHPLGTLRPVVQC